VKGVLVTISHFGAVEFITPFLSSLLLKMNVCLRFTTESFSQKAHVYAENMAKSGSFAPINFIEIGKPGTRAALDMASAIRRGEILVSVFDEETDYSIPVPLMGKMVPGGAGLHKLIQFAGEQCAVCTAHCVRREHETYF